jgi:hypothetical protein
MGDEPRAREYASHATDLLENLQQRWGTEVYNTYLARPDAQSLRKLLGEGFAINN